MADEAFLDGEGLTQVVTWLRDKDVGQYTDESKTNEIFNDYSNNKAIGTYNHAEGYNTQAIGAYNHAEGHDTMAGSYQDAYYRYCGNPILQVASGIRVISKVVIDSNDYQIFGETGTFSLNSIELPEDFTVGKYSSTLNIFNYDYIFNNNNNNNNNNKWYVVQIVNIEITDELNSLFTTLFENNSSINRKIYKVAAEPTEISNDLHIYNGAIYCSAFTDNKITVSEDTINTLTTINTLESQTDDGYITTIYVNESNYFGFVYYFDNDNLILSKQQYNGDTIYNITNLTNNYGTFKKIDKVYQSAPTITTQLGLVCNTYIDSTATPQYNGNSGKWEYLNEYNVILSITESDRTVYDSEGNPTDVVNPSLKVRCDNDEILINKTVDFATDIISFIYSKDEEETFNWYLDGNIVDLAEYGILVENQQEYDVITFELNKVYISYDSEGNQIEKTQEEFYSDNHMYGTTSYVFDGTESGNWVKTIKDGEIGNSSYCHAEGHGTKAEGEYTHAEGNYTIATEEGSHAEGSNTKATGRYSHAEGSSSKALGWAAHTEGYQTEATHYSHAEGCCTIADGEKSHAEGNETKAHGYSSHAEGYQTEASGWYSHIEGLSSIISAGSANHAEGQSNTISDGTANHTEGMSNTISTGTCNHAEGQSNFIYNGSYNHAEGGDHRINETGSKGYNSVRNRSNTVDDNYASDICGSNNTVKGCEYTSVSGYYNTVTNNSCHFIYGNHLISGDEKHKNNKTALVIGEYNNNNFINTEYVLTNDPIYYFNYGIQTYYYIKNDEYYPIQLLLYTTPNDKWYELVNNEYIQTQDKEMVENKEYYYRYSNTDYRLIKIANTKITQPIYEIKQYIMIAGNGFNENNRSNALELDYEGNLQTSGDIINGDGVVLGAYISNEKIDEIWGSVFGGGRVCLVQTNS